MRLTNPYEPFSEQLTRLTVGMDALERRMHRGHGLLDQEGLLPIYLGADLVEGTVYDGWDAVDADLATLEQRASGVAPAPRHAFVGAMLRSLRAALTLFRGGALSYADKVRDLVGAPQGPVDAHEIEAMRASIDARLRRSGVVRGTLPARIASWEGSRAIPAGGLARTFAELMATGRARTAARVFDAGEFSMALNPVRGVPYTARCAFDEGQMDLNVDLTFTRAALKHLVAHEVFPGHATQLLWTRARVQAATSHPEVLLCTANTVLGCVQEGIADEGVALIDWLEDEDDHIHLELRRLRSAAQTSAAWFLMAEFRAPQMVSDYLREVAAGQESWVLGRLKMAAHPFRGPFIASYSAGARAVRRVFERVAPPDYPRFIQYLYGQAHSPQSLDMYS